LGILSFIFHLIFFGTFLVTQKHKPGRIPKTSVINVSLVSAPQKAAGSKTAAKKVVTAPKPKTSKKKGKPKKDGKDRFETREKGARGFHFRQAESVPEEKNLQGVQGKKERAQGH
jgi:hypothetical protein